NKAERTAAEKSAAEPTAAEPVERRAETKGSADQQRTRRTQRRISVSKMLARIRQHIAAVDTQGGNVCGKAASTDLCGWREVTRVPTATAASSSRCSAARPSRGRSRRGRTPSAPAFRSSWDRALDDVGSFVVESGGILYSFRKPTFRIWSRRRTRHL